MYSVTETESVEVCVISSDNVRATIILNLTLVSGSAQSECLSYLLNQTSFYILTLAGGVDFVSTPSNTGVTFSSGTERICTEVTAVGDGVVEPEETFSVVLNTNQERITFVRNDSAITILDMDGKSWV